MLSSTLTTVVVFAPLALLSGVVGAFFAALALALAAAVLASLVIALTVVPLLAGALLRPRGRTRATSRSASRYGALLARALRRPRLRGRAALRWSSRPAALVATRVETGFIPEMDEGAYVLDYFTPIGTSLAEADALARADRRRSCAPIPTSQTFTRRLGAELGPPRRHRDQPRRHHRAPQAAAHRADRRA